MPLRAAALRADVCERYDARLARSILDGASDAPTAAMTLLEYSDPPTLTAAVALIADHGTVTGDTFSYIAEAWETYRHVKHQSWD